MRNLLTLLVVAILLASCDTKTTPKEETPKFTLKTDKTEYTVGETIKVEFTADPAWDKNAWVGIIPSSIAHGTEAENDKHDVAYKYLQNKASGTLEFTAKGAGEYDMMCV